MLLLHYIEHTFFGLFWDTLQPLHTGSKNEAYGNNHHSSKPQHVIGEWITLSNIQGKQGHYEVGYRYLEASSFYVFRVFACNSRGASFGSPESDQLHVPGNKNFI